VRSSQWLVPGWFIVFDVERFRQATILRYTGTVKRMLGDES